MTRSNLAGLVLLNIALLGMLALVTFQSSNEAQAVNASDQRAEYIAITGYIAGSKTPILWIVNQATQEVVAIQFDSQKDQIIGFGYRSLNSDFTSIQRNRQ